MGRFWSGREGSKVDRTGFAAGRREQRASERDECLGKRERAENCCRHPRNTPAKLPRRARPGALFCARGPSCGVPRPVPLSPRHLLALNSELRRPPPRLTSAPGQHPPPLSQPRWKRLPMHGATSLRQRRGRRRPPAQPRLLPRPPPHPPPPSAGQPSSPAGSPRYLSAARAAPTPPAAPAPSAPAQPPQEPPACVSAGGGDGRPRSPDSSRGLRPIRPRPAQGNLAHLPAPLATSPPPGRRAARLRRALARGLASPAPAAAPAAAPALAPALARTLSAPPERAPRA
ncbi:proline-rich protein 2-like [Mustela nigripes]|uniref:proline-rich protein 2-like n=1 Tax=Mustela nigripes TaxID=77151 RepID=UPI002815E235|nr:proline-rich protein 2-like [Mustela nigripes]